ncbi:MAG: PaaI family thioesterase [Candidatus Hodarchaeales archaeon]
MNEEQREDVEVLEPREIPNLWEFNCFGCSPTNDHGLQLRFYLSDNGCFTECTISDHFCGFAGMVHGGIITTLLDEISAWTITSRLFRVGITSEITTSYLNPVRANTKIRLEGEISNYNEKSAVVRSKITSSDGLLLAEADSKFLFPSVSTLAKIAEVDEQHIERIIARVIKPIRQVRRT